MKAMKLTAILMIAGSGAVFSGSAASAMQQGVSYPALYAGQYQAYHNGYGMQRNGYMTVADKQLDGANKATTVPKNQPQQPNYRPGYGQNGYGFGNGAGAGNGAGNANGAASGKGSGKASGGFNMGFNGNVKGNAAGNAAGNNNWAGNGRGWGQNSGGYNQNPWRAQVQKAPQGNVAPQMKAPSGQPRANMQMPHGSYAMPPQGIRQGQMRRPNMGMPNPNMNMPRGNMNMPNMRMPNMNMPNMRMPNVNMPNMRMPNMNMPNMNMPNMRMNPPGFRGYPPRGFQRPNMGRPMGQPMGRPMPQQRPAPMPQGAAVQPNINAAPKQPWYKRWGNTNPAQNGQKQGWWKRFSKPGQKPVAPMQQNAPTAPKQGGSVSGSSQQAPQFNNGYQQRPPYPQGWRQGGPNGGQAGMVAPNGGFFRQPPAPWMNQNRNAQVPPAPVAPTAKSDVKIAPKGNKESK